MRGDTADQAMEELAAAASKARRTLRKKAALDDAIVPATSARDIVEANDYTAPKRLPPCPELERIDELVRVQGGLIIPGAKIHTHEGSVDHAAGACCCAFEREVTARRLDSAREALLAFSEKMAAWQERLAGHCRRRMERRRLRFTLKLWHDDVLGNKVRRCRLTSG